jgi:hypothetical protein
MEINYLFELNTNDPEYNYKIAAFVVDKHIIEQQVENTFSEHERQEFRKAWSVERLEKFSESINSIDHVANIFGNTNSLFHRLTQETKYAGSAKYVNNINWPIYYSKELNKWCCQDASVKKDKDIIQYAREFLKNMIRCLKRQTIENFVSNGFLDINKYAEYLKKTNNMGKQYDRVWFHKYLSILYPEFFISVHSGDLKKSLISAMQIKADGDYYVKDEQIQKIVKYMSPEHRKYAYDAITSAIYGENAKFCEFEANIVKLSLKPEILNNFYNYEYGKKVSIDLDWFNNFPTDYLNEIKKQSLKFENRPTIFIVVDSNDNGLVGVFDKFDVNKLEAEWKIIFAGNKPNLPNDEKNWLIKNEENQMFFFKWYYPYYSCNRDFAEVIAEHIDEYEREYENLKGDNFAKLDMIRCFSANEIKNGIELFRNNNLSNNLMLLKIKSLEMCSKFIGVTWNNVLDFFLEQIGMRFNNKNLFVYQSFILSLKKKYEDYLFKKFSNYTFLKSICSYVGVDFDEDKEFITIHNGVNLGEISKNALNQKTLEKSPKSEYVEKIISDKTQKNDKTTRDFCVDKYTVLLNDQDDFIAFNEIMNSTLFDGKGDIPEEIGPRPVDIKEIEQGKEKHYIRHRDRAINALKSSNYCCEIDKTHQTFIKKNENIKYVECHHLVPMAYQRYFKDATLDTEPNIVALCSNCHRLLHYGKDSKILLEKLYKARITMLKRAGIDISFSELLKMYDLEE